MLKADETLISILSKYTDFVIIYSKNLIAEFLEYTKINNYTIDLTKCYQQLYRFIYSLSLVGLKNLEIFIKTNLANSFIRPFKSLINTFILFFKKSDGSF